MLVQIQPFYLSFLLLLLVVVVPEWAAGSQELFKSYEPLTTVTDDAAIDLDQKLIESQLALGTEDGRIAALAVYTRGAFSKSYAELTLQDRPLLVDVLKGEFIFGLTADGKLVRGTVLTAAKAGSIVLQVTYHPSPVQATWTDCHVGGNPTPNTNGCFAPSGQIEVGDLGQFSYLYDPLNENYNERNFQNFSTNAKVKLNDCDTGCPYPTYLKFYKYYGAYDYGNRWIMAAFENSATNFTKGNAQFGLYGSPDGTRAAITKGNIVLNLWMYIYRELEHAAYVCEQGKGCQGDSCTNDEDSMHSWDKAVAFYAGGQAKLSSDDGYLLYALAQKMCRDFGTCLQNGTDTGMAAVNARIFGYFREGRQNLLIGNCDPVPRDVVLITQLMAVPLIQGTLKHAFISGVNKNGDDENEAEGATFAAAVLPMLAFCNASDADTVYYNMQVGSELKTNFQAVKAAFERNYECLGITCSDVGGLLQIGGGYMSGAEPCHDASNPEVPTTAPSTTTTSTSSSSNNNNNNDGGPNVGLAVGLSLAIVAVFFFIALLIGSKSSDVEYDGPVDPDVA